MARLANVSKGLFEYNRKNFLEDREQRQAMEYKVMDMRIEQTGLWREDIRQMVEYSLTKVEMYMLVSTLLLGFCATAIVKAVVVKGTPAWLACAHTLTLCGSFMFLLISMVLGINAYVSAQAYMVRLLTQYVRLPIPTWEAIEASRTYGSTFEKQRSMQMFRTPWITGKHESHAEDTRNSGSTGNTAETCLGGTPQKDKASSDAGAADPWGLERRGDDIPELHPLVNNQCAKQRHIWLMREAGKFYLTHEAFCRVAMNIGTSYLALFFSYYCLSYCLVEDGAPQAAFAGMVVFVVVSICIIYMDVVAHSGQLVLLVSMQSLPPLLAAITTYVSFPDGYGGLWEYAVCIGLFMNGAWLLVYLHALRVRETDTGVFAPMAFKTALLLDVFGQHPHRSSIPRQNMPSGAKPTKGSESQNQMNLPALSFLDGPFRPEDLKTQGKDQDRQSNSWGPDTFFGRGTEEHEIGNISHGRKPGHQVWSVFKFAVFTLAFAWGMCCIFALRQAYQGNAHFVKNAMSWENKAEWTPIVSVALQTRGTVWRSERIHTVWPSAMAHPQSLACDPSGTTFVTFGRGATGRKSLLSARMTDDTSYQSRSRHKLAFSAAPLCEGLHVDGQGQMVQDIALHRCGDINGCSALVLPLGGRNLVSCQLQGDEPDVLDDESDGLGLFQRQAMMRKINRDEQAPNVDSIVEQNAFKHTSKPKASRRISDVLAAEFRKNSSIAVAQAWLDDPAGEDISSLAVSTCQNVEGGPADCPVLGTSAGRFVRMEPGRAADSGKAAWVPRRVLLEDETTAQFGSLTVIDDSRLGVLHKDGRRIRFVDTASPEPSQLMRLPDPRKGRHWAAVCAGGNSMFALESGEDPAIWRFTKK